MSRHRTFNILKKIFLGIAILIASILLLVAGSILFVVKNPLTTWQMIESKVLPSDMKITWSRVDLSVKHLSGINFYFDFQMDDLKIAKTNPPISLPIDSIRIETSLFPRQEKHKLVAHEWKVIATKPLSLKLAFEKKDEPEENPFQTFKKTIDLVKSIRTQLELQRINVHADDFKVQINDSPSIAGNLEIKKDQEQRPDHLLVTSGVTIGDDLKLKADGQIVFDPQDQQKISAKLDVDVQAPGLKVAQALNLNVNGEVADLSADGPVSFNQKKFNLKAQPQTSLKMDAKHITVKLRSGLQGLSAGTYAQVGSLQALIDMPLSSDKLWSDRASTVEVDIPADVFLVDENTKAAVQKECQCEVPKAIDFKIKGQLWLSYLISNNLKNKKPVADLDITVKELNNKLFSLSTAAQIKIEKEGNAFYYSPYIDLDAKVSSMRALTRILDAKRILVPSPLDILDGDLRLLLKGPVETTDRGFTFPAQASVRLKSPNQIVDVDATSSLFLDNQFKSADIGVKVTVNQLRLELPPLKPTRGNPRIINDKRILVEPKKPKDPSTFKLTLTVDVRTPTPGSITLLSEYFKPHLPLTVNISHAKDNRNTGSINIEPFDIEYVRRKVRVEKMKFDLSKSSDNGLFVDGQLSVKQTQYKVFIDVIGPVNKPNILLSSEPDLPRSEIINVLLFDRTGENKESGDAKTAGEVDAAVADKAIGLFGIWAFASTPIKGFSYNPSTKTYTAMVELADDLTASIGSKWESTAEVELRKQISRRWMLSAAWTPADQGDPETTKLVLQWERRF